MPEKPLSETDTRAKLIDPALHDRGWTEDLIRREETERGIEIIDGKPRRRARGRTDYLLRINITPHSQPVVIALIEAKKSSEPPDKGLERAKQYARLNDAAFVYSSNGHLFVEYDCITRKTSEPRPLGEFPTPEDLRKRYESRMKISLDSEEAKPLLSPYPGGEASRRYYQDAAIRAVLEKIAKKKNRVLLYLATGAGKTFIAVHTLKKIADAGQLRRALFVCDRDELRTQGITAFQNVFGSDAAEVSGKKPQKNARILIATYQTLNISREEEDAKFFTENYPKNYFSHIVIDECHRSAWKKWSIVLTTNPDAIQIGLTATPRSFKGGTEEERREDEEITANNLKYFGDPVYEYDMAQGIEDGYLPACEIIQRIPSLDPKGVSRKDIERLGAKDALTGQEVPASDTREHYLATIFEDKIQLPDRVQAMCKDLFEMFLQTGGPHQKTVIFCTRDTHADQVVRAMNNLYADYINHSSMKPADYYAFKCTSSIGGSELIPELRGSQQSHFIATTVDLITTGVDIPCLRNVVFFKYVRSPISFQQMMGRGSRIDLSTNKLMFRVYDYTDATRLLGKGFEIRPRPTKEPTEPPDGPKEKTIRVEGFEVKINPAGTYIVIKEEGQLKKITVEEYRQKLAEKLIEEIKTPDDLRSVWIDPQRRKLLIESLPESGRGLYLIKNLQKQEKFDYFDILAEMGYGAVPRSREERVQALEYKYREWFDKLPHKTAKTILALAKQFEKSGIEELENPYIFNAPEVVKAGGLAALKILGEPKDIILDTKRKLFSS